MKLLAIVLAFFAGAALAGVPNSARPLLPVLAEEMAEHWPTGIPAEVAAQVHKETCITPTHRFCWNPRAELKTSREYGFGLGQHTIAYRKDGTERFNVWADLRSQHRTLSGWTWANRYDARLQLRAVILYDARLEYSCARIMDDARECAFSAYNGGLGGVLQDRKLCEAIEGCNPRLWWNNVERHSLKQKTALKGYGNSFFDINRSYVRWIMLAGRELYEGAI